MVGGLHDTEDGEVDHKVLAAIPGRDVALTATIAGVAGLHLRSFRHVSRRPCSRWAHSSARSSTASTFRNPDMVKPGLVFTRYACWMGSSLTCLRRCVPPAGATSDASIQ